MYHVVQCPIRWSDMDAYGHVNNARFLTLLEEARIDLLFGEAGRGAIGSLDGGLLVRSQTITYERPVRHGDPFRVEMWISDIRGASFTVGYETFVEDVRVARASSELVRYDLDEDLVRRLSTAECDFLGAYVDE